MDRKWDWRESAFVDRGRAINEIHLRAGRPIRRYARVTHMVRVSNSPSDRFREALYDHFWASPPSDGQASLVGDRRLGPEALTPPQGAQHEFEVQVLDRQRAIKARQDVAKAALRALRTNPPWHTPFLNPKILDRSRRIKAALEIFRRCAEKVEKDASRKDETQEIVDEVAKLVALYDQGSALDPDKYTDPGAPKTTARKHGLRPYSPGVGPLAPGKAFNGRRLWLNLWRRTPKQTTHSDNLRLSWELYDDNHNFTLFEDFRNKTEASKAQLIRNRQDWINTRITAIENADACLKALTAPPSGDDKQDDSFKWRGELFALAHYFIIPFEDLLKRQYDASRTKGIIAELKTARHAGTRPSAELMEALTPVLAEEALRYFAAHDRTRATGTRSDFILSMVADGGAFLISDLSPDNLDELQLERASRTIIFDVCLNDEERGRLIKLCTDLATYRMLGVRSYANFFPAAEVINDVANSLSRRLGNQYGTANRLQELKTISECLDAINLFITDGINGAASQAVNYSRLIDERLEQLGQIELAGYQSVSSMFARFTSSTLNAKRFADRYEQVRSRVAESRDLIRADIEHRFQHSVYWFGAVALVLTGIGAIGAFKREIGELWMWNPEIFLTPLLVVVIAFVFLLTRQRK